MKTLIIQKARELGLDEPTTKRLIYKFLEVTRDTLHNLEEAVQRRNVKDVHDRIHHIRGAALGLGLVMIIDIIQRIEAYADRGDWDAARRELKNFGDALDSLCKNMMEENENNSCG